MNYLQNAVGSTLKEHFEKSPLTNEDYQQRLNIFTKNLGMKAKFKIKFGPASPPSSLKIIRQLR